MGMGKIDALQEVKAIVPVKATYEPSPDRDITTSSLWSLRTYMRITRRASVPSMKGGGNVVSPYRWVILFTTIPVIIATEIMWLSLSPISSVAEEFYGVESLSITLFTMSYMIMFIIFSIPASFVIDRYGYRASLIIGALLTGILV